MTKWQGRKTLDAADTHLAAADPVMARLIASLGPCRWEPHRRDPFEVLVHSVVSQQLQNSLLPGNKGGTCSLFYPAPPANS